MIHHSPPTIHHSPLPQMSNLSLGREYVQIFWARSWSLTTSERSHQPDPKSQFKEAKRIGHRGPAYDSPMKSQTQQSRNPKQSLNSKWNHRSQSPKHFQHSTLNQLPPNFLFNFATAVNIAFKIQLKPLHSVNKNKFCPNSWQTLWGRVILVKRWRETTSVVTRKRLAESILTSWT